MQKKEFDNKATFLSLFILATIGFTYIGLNEVFAQTTTGANQTETLKSLGKLTGSDQKIISQDKTISNPNNTMGNSLATNQFQSY